MKYLIAIFLTGLVIISGCKKEKEPVRPALDYTYSGNTGIAPVAVFFEGTVSNASMISWAFGDGGNGQALSLNHTYDNYGVYQVDAMAMSEEGGTTKTIKSVPVSPYTKIAISQITFSVPAYKPGGATWDTGTGSAPDVYIKVYNASGTLLNAGTAYQNNTYGGNFSIAPTVFIYDFVKDFTVKVYDYDGPGASDELIAAFSFRAGDYFNSTLPFQSIFTRTDAGTSVSVHVIWV